MLLSRQNPPPPKGHLIDTPGKRAGTAIAIVVGVILIVIAGYFCCCRNCYKNSKRATPTTFLSHGPHAKDLERNAEIQQNELEGTQQQQGQTYEMSNQTQVHHSAPVQLPTYTGHTNNMDADLIQADGRRPADEPEIAKEVHDPPPEYPGSPIPQPAQLATTRPGS